MPSSISFSQFRSILKTLNPSLRVYESRTRPNSLIYQVNGNHPYANELGLLEICGYPTPAFHHSFPKYSFKDVSGRLGRGYTSVFRLLAGKRLINRARLRALLPCALDVPRGRPVLDALQEEKPIVPIHTFQRDIQVSRN